MKVLCGEGLASHTDPESCAGVREDVGEALTGESAGRVLSREIIRLGCRRRPLWRKATPAASPSREAAGPCAVRDPEHARKPFTREPGGLLLTRGDWRRGSPGEAQGRTPGMDEQEESDGLIVPRKRPNKDGTQRSAEVVEGRGPAEGNQSMQTTGRAQYRHKRCTGASAGRAPPQGPLARRTAPAVRRDDLRQEPSAVVPHAGICAGGPG